jgi:hypothetical protein
MSFRTGEIGADSLKLDFNTMVRKHLASRDDQPINKYVEGDDGKNLQWCHPGLVGLERAGQPTNGRRWW